MKVIREMRQQQAWEQQKSTSPLPIIIGAVIAFGIGLLGVSGIVRAPDLHQQKTQMVPVAPRNAAAANTTIDTGARKTGRAEEAPLLKTCVPLAKFDAPADANPAELYRLLHSASSMSRVAALAGVKQSTIDDARFAEIWADVADCVYRQNGWMLCDPDNRALAAESASTLVRHLLTAKKAEKLVDDRAAKPVGFDRHERAYALQNAASVKARVLAGVRTQVAEGRLSASDFGMFAPTEILDLVRETKVTQNACATRSRP
jgi:hypothetical protein